MRYHHVDVFTGEPYAGNSLAVFPDATGLTGAQMARITRELRHFESIFLFPGPAEDVCGARVFDLDDELDFAGHPVLGAACVLHAVHPGGRHRRWTLQLAARAVSIATEQRDEGRYAAVLDQGPAEFLDTPRPDGLAAWFGLDAADLDPELPPAVVSTGLRYLVVPVRPGALAGAGITADVGARLAGLGAQFAYLLDAAGMEGRHWTNDGRVEDVATGSAAGCVAAYLRRHRRIGDGEDVLLHQGRFTGRPSRMHSRAHGAGSDIRSVEVGGEVVLVGSGELNRLPS